MTSRERDGSQEINYRFSARRTRLPLLDFGLVSHPVARDGAVAAPCFAGERYCVSVRNEHGLRGKIVALMNDCVLL